ELFRWPKTRQDWWKAKIETTKATDARNMNELNALGYKICHIWECALKGRSQIPDEAIIGELGSWLREETDRTLIIRGA
ncbi:MAG TPA: hypothetical protein PK691_08750, partial [Thermomicrobiales bacterium]|nr:hypothetical protein [Thermomicrobiales bacterium]